MPDWQSKLITITLSLYPIDEWIARPFEKMYCLAVHHHNSTNAFGLAWNLPWEFLSSNIIAWLNVYVFSMSLSYTTNSVNAWIIKLVVSDALIDVINSLRWKIMINVPLTRFASSLRVVVVIRTNTLQYMNIIIMHSIIYVP